MLETLISERFRDQSVRQVWAQLLDEGTYLFPAPGAPSVRLRRMGSDSNSLQRVRFAQTLSLTNRVLPPAKKMIARQSGYGIRTEGTR